MKSDELILVQRLTGCARCGGAHPNLPFRKLGRPVLILAGNKTVKDVTLTHWAVCPTTAEPILMEWLDATGQAG